MQDPFNWSVVLYQFLTKYFNMFSYFLCRSQPNDMNSLQEAGTKLILNIHIEKITVSRHLTIFRRIC